jgi:hypothetical protein
MLLVKEPVGTAEEEDMLPERRRGLRIRQNRSIKIFEPAVSRYFGGQTHDISSSGLRLELPLATPVRPGRIVNIHVSAESDGVGNHRQMLPARVVWIDREGDRIPGRMVAGVEFLSAVAAQANVA